ncbi:MAG: hypothetical protein ISS70_08240 [Phycisphaerae bacterium]|nr:hypothetical protein [Phycisphaerae bacterium]
MKQSKGLTAFVRDECANYSKHDEGCLFDESCKVMDGRRCDYFEKAVLGPPDYKYKLPGYDYQKLFAQYAEQTEAERQQVEVRRCECGTPLRHRQRYCDDCTMKRRRKTKRVSQKAWRMAV